MQDNKEQSIFANELNRTRIKRRFSSLEVWKFRELKGLRVEGLNRKFSSLAAWKPGKLIGLWVNKLIRNNKMRLSRRFANIDFINLINPLTYKLINCKRAVFVFTMAERRSSRFLTLGNSLAFTMAEILISLTIIGVIAAITLPSLRANINEKTWATQRKALYSRMSQAISMMPSLNGYGEYAGTWEDDVFTPTVDTAAERFVTDGLSKVLQINNICTIPMNTSSENARKELKKCGISEKFTTMNNSKKDFPTNLIELNPMFTNYINTNAVALETKNGESIAVFYNPQCFFESLSINSKGETYSSVSKSMCANFLYDLNGKKGPNKVGKDIGFISAIYPADSEVVAPIPLSVDARDIITNNFPISYRNISKSCTAQDKDSRVPNIEELMAIKYNEYLINNLVNGGYWSSTVFSDNTDKSWCLYFQSNIKQALLKENYSKLVRCVKR